MAPDLVLLLSGIYQHQGWGFPVCGDLTATCTLFPEVKTERERATGDEKAKGRKRTRQTAGTSERTVHNRDFNCSSPRVVYSLPAWV